MPLVSLLDHELIAKQVLGHLEHAQWLNLVLGTSKHLMGMLDKQWLWEAQFDILCSQLRSPYARFDLTGYVPCKHLHQPSSDIEKRYTVNLHLHLNRGFARQAIPQFLTARRQIEDLMPPEDMPSAEFKWSDPPSATNMEVRCGTASYAGFVPLHIHYHSMEDQLSLVVLGDLEDLCAEIEGGDVMPESSFECSECGAEHHGFESAFDDDF